VPSNDQAQQRRGPSELEHGKTYMPPPSAAADGSAALPLRVQRS
jgi:hypothetical protein